MLDRKDESSTPKAARGRSLLLVDDDVDYLLATRLMLEAKGYRVSSAEGVREAQTLLEANAAAAAPSFDAAIVDLMMEECDGGFALCHLLKRRWPGLPVVMVSAVTEESGFEFTPQGAGGEWMQADAFLAKPIRIEQLERELDRLLED